MNYYMLLLYLLAPVMYFAIGTFVCKFDEMLSEQHEEPDCLVLLFWPIYLSLLILFFVAVFIPAYIGEHLGKKVSNLVRRFM